MFNFLGDSRNLKTYFDPGFVFLATFSATEQCGVFTTLESYPSPYSLLTCSPLRARSLAKSQPCDQASATVVVTAENKTQHPQAQAQSAVA